MTCKTAPRTSGDSFLKNGEYLMSKSYLYCIDRRFFVPILLIFKPALKFKNEKYMNKLSSCDVVVFLRH